MLADNKEESASRREKHTDTESDHIDTHDDGAHGGWEELANPTQHHDHTDRDVDETAADMVSIVFFFRSASPVIIPSSLPAKEHTRC